HTRSKRDWSSDVCSSDLSDYLMTHLEQDISRIEGIGEVDVFGSQYAMRIWLNPAKLKQYNLMPSDVRAAIEAQNTQVAAGAIGRSEERRVGKECGCGWWR